MNRTDNIHALVDAVNQALSARNSNKRIMYKGAFGKAGLDWRRPGDKNPEDVLTGYMPKKQLETYLEAMLNALYMVNE